MAIRVGFSKIRKSVLGIFLFALVFSGGYFLGVNGYKAEVDKALKVSLNRQIPPDKNVDFNLFWQVWDTLNANYYDKSKLIPSEMVYGAIGGMVGSVGDPYTMFLPPKENKIVNEDLSGKLEGVGIQIGYKDKRLAVISPLPGSPAEKAGVKAGDYIVHIKDDKRGIDMVTNGISINEAVQAIRGPAGTKVTLTLVREDSDEPIVIEIVRAELNIPSVTLDYVGDKGNVAHIKIIKFDADTINEWDKTVGEVNSKCQSAGNSCEGLILDLRNNPGGYLQSAVDIAADFLPNATVVVVEEKGNGTKIEFKTDKLPRLQKYKVVVLINEGSASASEILAGALRDQRGFKLVGDQSFGKGTVQEPIEIPGGSGIHVTIAKWLTPKGTWVHDEGLEPDILVLDDDESEGDEQLKKAIESISD